MAEHRSFHQLIDLIVLGVMSLFLRNLSPYEILPFSLIASSCPEGGLEKGGPYDLEGWDTGARCMCMEVEGQLLGRVN